MAGLAAWGYCLYNAAVAHSVIPDHVEALNQNLKLADYRVTVGGREFMLPMYAPVAHYSPEEFNRDIYKRQKGKKHQRAKQSAQSLDDVPAPSAAVPEPAASPQSLLWQVPKPENVIEMQGFKNRHIYLDEDSIVLPKGMNAKDRDAYLAQYKEVIRGGGNLTLTSGTKWGGKDKVDGKLKLHGKNVRLFVKQNPDHSNLLEVVEMRYGKKAHI